MSTTTTTKTEVNSVRELVSSTSLLHIRPQTITIEASLLKPNTRMYMYFDGASIDSYVRPENGYLGDPVLTDSSGKFKAYFEVPEATFASGEKEIRASDSSVFVPDDVVGFNEVRARAIFAANGTLETYQTTETTTITTTVTTTVVNYDPLAQSFFTYGITGGCFITSIDLYFFTKDETLPAWIELREMVNGYPGPKLIDTQAISIMDPDDINVSDDATAATRFTFPKMIYLEQDRDYCFVVRSNASTYNLWTSRMGETANETGMTVFEQPYMGSLFKSENNVTWTAEQTEDIKFVMNYAKFDTNASGNLDIALRTGGMAIECDQFITTSGSNEVSLTLPVKHGLTIDSKIVVIADEDGEFNGIPGSLIQGDFNITSIPDEFSVVFQIPGALANTSGAIETGGNVKDIILTNGGSGYSSTTLPIISIEKNDTPLVAGAIETGKTYTIVNPGNTDFVSIGASANTAGVVFIATGSGAGTGTVHYGEPASAVAKVVNGVISEIRVTNPGSGYFVQPTVSITASIGSGASGEAFMRPVFNVVTNRIYHKIKPMVHYATPGDTDIVTTLDAITGAYEGGNLSSYSGQRSYNIDLKKVTELDSNLLLASRENEIARLGGANGNLLSIDLSSTNPNVSPVIDLQRSRFHLRSYFVNNQKDENVKSNNPSGSIQTITVINGGDGYTEVPTVTIEGSGTGATATATIAGGEVTAITVDTAGEGYYGNVTVSITGGGSGVVTNATAIASVSDYNSELLSGKGTAEARYLTQPQILENASRGLRIYATAFSNTFSNFDIYIQTIRASSGDDLDEQLWQRLNCDIERNKSITVDQLLEYEFYLDDMSEFDVYRLKFVLRTKTPWQPPKIINYRAILLA